MTDETRQTIERLDEIEARADAATPGPWEIAAPQPVHNEVANVRGQRIRGGYKAIPCISDAEFISKSREDVPALIAAVRELSEAKRAVEAFERNLGKGEVSDGAGKETRRRGDDGEARRDR